MNTNQHFAKQKSAFPSHQSRPTLHALAVSPAEIIIVNFVKKFGTELPLDCYCEKQVNSIKLLQTGQSKLTIALHAAG